MDIKKTLDALRSIEEGTKFHFSGENRGQKPGDQVRGTDKAKTKKSGAHPFAGRLVGAAESTNLLTDLEKQIIEGGKERELAEAFANFEDSNMLPGLDSDSPIHGTTEGDLNEYAPYGGDDDNGPDEEEILFRLAKQWWNGTEQEMIRAERTLASMGWEIGEDEGYDEGGVFVVRAGDEHGKSYMSWSHNDLDEVNEGVAETTNSPKFQSMISKITSPEALDTREAIALVNDLVYQGGASYKEALQQASISYEMDPAELDALYKKQEQGVTESDDDMFAEHPGRKFQRALKNYAQRDQDRINDYHSSWRTDPNYRLMQDRIAFILDLAADCNTMHGFIRTLMKLAKLIDSGRGNIWVYDFDEWLYENGYSRLSDLWERYDEQLNEGARVFSPDSMGNLFYKPDPRQRKAQLIKRLVPSNDVDDLVSKLANHFGVGEDEFEWKPISNDEYQITEYGMTTGGMTQSTGMNTPTTTPATAQPDPNVKANNAADTQKIQQGLNKIKGTLPVDQRQAINTQTTKGLDAVDNDQTTNPAQQGAITKAFGPTLADIAQDPALLNKFNVLVRDANRLSQTKQGQ